jgi:hypothetical protein
MKKILFAFLLIGTFIQCSKGDPSATFNLLSLEQNFGPQATQVPFEGQYTFFRDVSYGTKPQNKLDIILPSESDIKGVVLYLWHQRRSIPKPFKRVYPSPFGS